MILPLEYEGFYRKYNESTFDGIHNGWDLKAPEGTKTFAISDGIVLLSSEIHGFGGLNPSIPGGAVFILHENIAVLYGHLNRLVKTGDKVRMGGLIGTVRDFVNKDPVNGTYHAPHLHFAVWNEPGMPPPPYGYPKKIGLWIDGLKYICSKLLKLSV